jgi:hypothetical protein
MLDQFHDGCGNDRSSHRLSESMHVCLLITESVNDMLTAIIRGWQADQWHEK